MSNYLNSEHSKNIPKKSILKSYDNVRLKNKAKVDIEELKLKEDKIIEGIKGVNTLIEYQSLKKKIIKQESKQLEK